MKQNRIEAYHFYEQDWESYADLAESFSWEIPDHFNISDYICDRWADDSERIALISPSHEGEEKKYTYGDLEDLSTRLANYFRDAGIEKGDHIGVSGSQRVETIVAHLAAFKLGAVTVPLSTLHGPDGIQYRLDDCDAKAFVGTEDIIESVRDVRESLEGLETTVTIGDVNSVPGEIDFWTAISNRSDDIDTVPIQAGDPACVLYTSGSTGQPKGVVRAHGHVLGLLPAYVNVHQLDIESNNTVRTTTEWSWMGSISAVVFPAMFYGHTLIAYERDQFDPRTEFELIDRYEITRYSVPPTAMRMMRSTGIANDHNLESVQSIASGGENVDPDIVTWVEETFQNASFIEQYGQTESPVVVYNSPALDVPHRENRLGIQGIGYEVRILDPDTLEVIDESGTVGEIAIRYNDERLHMLEYYNLPEKTAKKIQEGWLLTEDLGSIDEQGYFSFHSRADDVIISSGYRISPAEIEESLRTHEVVDDAGVIGVDDDVRGTVPKAYVVLVGESTPSKELREELQNHVKDSLAKYEYPRHITFVDELPRTPSGKVRRAALVDDD